MLKIIVPGEEFFDYEKQEFTYGKDTVLQLEHSLVSISKWESKWHIPFLDKKTDKTTEQTLDYVKCMTLTQNVDPSVYGRITNTIIQEIVKYIEDPMTATWFSTNGKKPARNRNEKVMTAELIYYQMIALNIPFECQKWHLNKLLTLIKVCDEENKPKEKRKAKDISADYAKLNAMRRAKLNSRG